MAKRTCFMLCLMVGALAACAPKPQPDSLVLVIVDTCRADRFGAVRGAQLVTPEMTTFAAQAVTFTRAYAQAPWTLPSIASIFTSQIPAFHGAGGRLGEFRSLSDEAVTLAEVCRDADLATALVSNVQFLSEKFGLTQGFDQIDAYLPESNLDTRRATATTDAALTWLEQNREHPFLLVVHYFDPHLVYDPPQPYRRRFAAAGDEELTARQFGRFSQIQQMRRGTLALSPATYQRLGGLYDGEVAYADAEFGRLLRELTELDLGSRAAVVVMSDHGEEFAEHGSFEHGHTQYDELLHVPLLIRAPGLVAGARSVTEPVALTDVAPTLCALIGIAPPPSFNGRSLVPLLHGESLPPRPIVSQGSMWGRDQVALRSEDWKLIVETIPAQPPGSPTQRYELFDLQRDPGELRNLAEHHPERLAAMRAQLDDLLLGQVRDGEAPELNAAERDRLRSLGYVR